MPKITRITDQASKKDRLSIYIDGNFCTGIRKRTFQAMDLKVGDEISCEQLKEKENFFWKESYQKEGAWKKEKVRIDKISALIAEQVPEAEAHVVGFGADSEEIIKEHPDEKGKPDIDVIKKSNGALLLKIEVTGSERLRNYGYWIRPDKLEYIENNPVEDVWIILHYAEPQEKYVFIKPISGKQYERHTIIIRGAGEIMCIFNDGDQEIKTQNEFIQYLRSKL